MQGKRKTLIESCQYCGKGHPHRHCPIYGKVCSGGGKDQPLQGGIQVDLEAAARTEVSK